MQPSAHSDRHEDRAHAEEKSRVFWPGKRTICPEVALAGAKSSPSRPPAIREMTTITHPTQRVLSVQKADAKALRWEVILGSR